MNQRFDQLQVISFKDSKNQVHTVVGLGKQSQTGFDSLQNLIQWIREQIWWIANVLIRFNDSEKQLSNRINKESQTSLIHWAREQQICKPVLVGSDSHQWTMQKRLEESLFGWNSERIMNQSSFDSDLHYLIQVNRETCKSGFITFSLTLLNSEQEVWGICCRDRFSSNSEAENQIMRKPWVQIHSVQTYTTEQ